MRQSTEDNTLDLEAITLSDKMGFRDLEQHVRGLLRFIGEDPNREGLLETPARVSRAWAEWTEGYQVDPASVLKSFEDGAPRNREMILVTDIPIYSHCEHHLAPFFGRAHIAYIPDGRIVGLSKLERLVNVFARRLQVQERMTSQIADAFFECVEPLGVAVVAHCRHMCMESRGIRTQNSTTLTTATHGSFATDSALRSEFFAMLQVQVKDPMSNGQ